MAGEARVLGIDPASGSRDLREQVGIVLQQCGVQSDLSVTELLEMYGRYHVKQRPVDEVIELVELTEKRDTRAKDLSGGQRRRLDLALALVGDPELIFLDEPTTGFDPAARRQAWSTIRSLCELGKTVFLTTHFMDEAQYLADRVAVMRAGEIIALGRPDELGGRDAAAGRDPLLAADGMVAGRSAGAAVRCRARSRATACSCRRREPVRATNVLTGWALEHDIELGHFSVTQPTLEDIYLELTGSAEERRIDRAQFDHRGGDGMSTTRNRLSAGSGSRPSAAISGWSAGRSATSSAPTGATGARGIFTFAFPVMFLVIFASLDKGQTISTRGGIPYDDFFVPGILAYGVIAVTFINMAISTAILRDEGVLKRMQGTPLPRWAYVAARIGSTFLIMLAMTFVVLALGIGVWGVHLRAGALPGLIVILLLGTAAFTSLGIGITRFTPNAESGPGDRQPAGSAADVHLKHLVPDRFAAHRGPEDRELLPDQGARGRTAVCVRSAPPWHRPEWRGRADARNLGRDRRVF